MSVCKIERRKHSRYIFHFAGPGSAWVVKGGEGWKLSDESARFYGNKTARTLQGLADLFGN